MVSVLGKWLLWSGVSAGFGALYKLYIKLLEDGHAILLSLFYCTSSFFAFEAICPGVW
jgi:hypothetical protein